MHRKTYTLSDIEKMLTWIPPIFILVIMVLSIVVTQVVMDHRQESEIALLTQKQYYTQRNHLDNYIAAVNRHIADDLSAVQKELKRSVHTLEGIRIGLGDDHDIQTLEPYMHAMEQAKRIQFVLFDRNLTILYGRNQLAKIEALIFNKYNDPELLKITMLYILSQGKNSSLSWKNDLDKTIQLSYFDRNVPEGIFVGAFSRVDDLRSITLQGFETAMRTGEFAPEGYRFYLYDHSKHRVFNLHHQHRWRPLASLDSHAHSRTLDRYFLSIGISAIGNPLAGQIDAIHQTYANKQARAITIIVLVGVVLMVFAWLFSGFIKRIFSIYNMRVHHTSMRIKRLKERYELAIIASNDGLWDTNFITKKTYFSQKWLDILGYRPGEIASFEAWLELMHPDDRQRVLATIDRHKQEHLTHPIFCEYRLRTRAGNYIWMLGRGKVFWDDDGRPLRLLMMSMDISEQKEASDKLAEMVRKEVAKNQEKQKLLIQQNKLAAMGEMIGAIAHQWRQPLNNITLILHFIRDNADNEAFTRPMLEEYVARAKKQIDYMSETIDDFRNFHKPSKNKALFDVRDAIASTLSIMETQFEKNAIDVSLEGDSFGLDGYENEFRQAILNILTNAKDAIVHQQENHAGFRGKISIVLDSNRITVYNNGGTVSDEVLDRMFEPYFTTKFEDKGTGIGLYMTQTIIEHNMHGDITVANKDQGVCFTIQFHHEEGAHDQYTRTSV
jgi:PAS domain S-box-containing protein